MFAADIYNTQFKCVSENESLTNAFKMLKEFSFNSLVVIQDDGKVSGVICVQDILKKVVPPEFQDNTMLAEALYRPNFFKERCSLIKDSKVKDIMRRDIYVAEPTTSIMEIAAEFLHSQLPIVPICEDERILGVISRTEMRKVLLKNFDMSSIN
jgi:predicted transcriptional regulator